jgi:hypothetical protein
VKGDKRETELFLYFFEMVIKGENTAAVFPRQVAMEQSARLTVFPFFFKAEASLPASSQVASRSPLRPRPLHYRSR